MNSKEYYVEVAKNNIRHGENKVREAQRNLDEGYKKCVADVATAQAGLDRAKAEMEREYGCLKDQLEFEKINLDTNKKYLEFQEAELAHGFES